MKRILIKLIIAAMMLNFFEFHSNVINVKADDSENSITYTLEGATLHISGSGMTNTSYFDIPWQEEVYSNVIIDEGITGIGEFAFCNARYLKSIIIPDSVTNIGNHAFQSCDKLTSIEIPNSVTTIGDYAFSFCSSLTDFIIPDSVESLGIHAFEYCSDLKNITLSNGMKTIESNTFEECSSLLNIEISNNITSIGNYAFYKCKSLKTVSLADTVDNIGPYAFSNCTSLTEFTIPNSITKIEMGTFSACDSLKQVIFSNNLKTIGDSAFLQCKALSSIDLPDSLLSILDYAFDQCDLLKNVEIPKNVLIIGDRIFSSNLIDKVKVDENNTTYDSRNNCNAIIETSSNTLIFGCKNTIIPDSVTSINKLAFFGCNNLNTIEIPSSITSIGVSAFYNCGGLTSITIPDTVTYIAPDCFENCNNLVIYCYDDSYAESFAIDNNISYEVINKKEIINVYDLYTDVASNDWYTENIQYVVDKGLMSGYGGTSLFGTNDTVTRAQMIQVLYNMAGKPEVTDYTATSKFSDVNKGNWYEDAVNWAYNNSITVGMGTTFGANESMTREQMVKFLRNYAKLQGLDIGQSLDISMYNGYIDISEWALDDMSWAVKIELIGGVQLTNHGRTYKDLKPNGTATRAQLATVLANFCKYYNL